MPLILPQLAWAIGDGRSIAVYTDAWISSLPLAQWPTFVSVDLDHRLRVCDLLDSVHGGWLYSILHRLFGPDLVATISAIPVPCHPCSDRLLWRESCSSRASPRQLAQLRPRPSCPSISVHWIWRLPAQPRVCLFLWKVAWGRLPTRHLLSHRGFAIPDFCPVCGLHAETIDHVLLQCSRSRLIWASAGFRPWESEQDQWIPSFLHSLQSSSPIIAGRIAAIAFHIWWSRNCLVFEDRLIPIQRLLRQALQMAAEVFQSRLDLTSLRLVHWGPLAASAALPSRVSSSSWVPPPPGFIKVNFDGSVRGMHGGAGFVIRSYDGSLLAVGGLHLVHPSVIQAELSAAWAGLRHAVSVLRAERVYLEGDSTTIIDWVRAGSTRHPPHPLLQDIWLTIDSLSACSSCHVYRQTNRAADWVASFVAHHTGSPPVIPLDLIPGPLRDILYADFMGFSL